LLNAHGGNVEVMGAYIRHLQMQQESDFEDR
jgi:creatinine amidohydrolase/Fe(II)-dependent formamide hydrolase-like protein